MRLRRRANCAIVIAMFACGITFSVKGGEALAAGPDIIVSRVNNIQSYGHFNGISAFSVGTTSCNIGDTDALWIASDNRHPVIAQNMYRLKANRFEQIGMSWLKHGFSSVNGTECGECACRPLCSSSRLGVGCSDPYDAALNGTQQILGPRSQVNAFTGYFPYPFSAPPIAPCGTGNFTPECYLPRRLQVHDSDLDPNLNPGALYFMEAQYVTGDEATAGNGGNNASYRRIRFLFPPPCRHAGTGTLFDPDEYCAGLIGGVETQQRQAAIRAWQDNDPAVVETDVNVPENEGLMILAAKSIDLGNGFFEYEYALQNLTSDRSAGSFRVPVPAGAIVGDIGFHDVDYHSGEPYDGTDWPGVAGAGGVTWQTTAFIQNPNANALRWGTLYNFRFRVNRPPAATTVLIGLFKPGFPQEVAALTIGPEMGLIDCNGNAIDDTCDVVQDVDCVGAPPTCQPPCAASLDCNTNGRPDECEPDCNNNDIPDTCDIGSLFSADCNGNQVPDECEPDCDGDGVPDVCDTHEDTDADGVENCFDLCPETTPAGGCICPPTGCCYFATFPDQCFAGYPREACIEAGGTPECLEPCRDGCLVGDWDLDGDTDLGDVNVMWTCFSGPIGTGGFVEPSVECLLRFDLDGDGDVDTEDMERFERVYSGP